MNNKIVQPEGNFYDKYHSKNPIIKWMMKKYFTSLDDMLIRIGKVKNILEAGCGEGEVINYINLNMGDECVLEAFDISEKVIRQASLQFPKIKFKQGDIYNISSGGYDLVVCCEVLEHLEDPMRALQELKRVSDKFILLSVPREPMWRCLNILRGKYLRRWGNTPGHIRHWNRKSFIDFCADNQWRVAQCKCPMPWTMVLLERE